MNTAWVVNPATGAMSRYDNLPWHTVVRVGGDLLALGDEHFYRLDADDDAGTPIPCEVRTGQMLLGSTQRKRLGQMTFDYAAQQPLTVAINGHTYALEPRSADTPRGNRLTPGKGLFSKFYEFTLRNPAGGVFELYSVGLDVAPSINRRT